MAASAELVAAASTGPLIGVDWQTRVPVSPIRRSADSGNAASLAWTSAALPTRVLVLRLASARAPPTSSLIRRSDTYSSVTPFQLIRLEKGE